MTGLSCTKSFEERSVEALTVSSKERSIAASNGRSIQKKRSSIDDGLRPAHLATESSKNTSKLEKTYGYQTYETSPFKKRRLAVAYMDEASDVEDYGSSFATIQGRAATRAAVHSNKIEKLFMKGSELQKKAELQVQRSQLPIAKGRDALVHEFMENDSVVLIGETGSGKTTQVPQYILEAGICGNGLIAVTQSRRVAAITLARRVADEQGVVLGTRVGYAVRFDEMHGASTRIKYMTDGMLARELLTDPLLSRYSVIIVDEAHERTLNTDLLLASLKDIQRKRHRTEQDTKPTISGKGKGKEQPGKLKIIVMSATLDAEKFSKFLNNAKVLYVKGRQHRVKIFHTVASQVDYVDAALRTFFQIHIDQPPGDVLIFLPGQEDIESLDKAITTYAAQLPLGQLSVVTCPMYASLPQSQQQKAFRTTPKGSRKCILATNIAETSITLPGVKYVIDTGKHKEKRHLAGFSGGGMDTLLTQDICKSSAHQRAGRAGREGPGECYRLYTEADYNNLPDTSIPEIQRCSLMSSYLQLKSLGLDLQTLDFMDKPDNDSINSAMRSLFYLEALDAKCGVTTKGKKMNALPVEPSHARALLAAHELGCMKEVLGIVSVLSASSKLFFDFAECREAAHEARSRFRHSSGDHLTALAVLRAYEELVESRASRGARREWCRGHHVNERTLVEAMSIQDQLKEICERQGMNSDTSSSDDVQPVLKSLLTGLKEHAAFLRNGGYKQAMGQSIVKVHPGSVLASRKAPAIMYDELVFTGSTYARGVSAVDPQLVLELSVVQLR